jgi:O-antigen biosynthesis protein WbqP
MDDGLRELCSDQAILHFGGGNMRPDSDATRLFDPVIAMILLVILLPVTLACMLAIRLTSPGSSVLSQQRVGLNRAVFTMYKLRTMHAGTPALPTHVADPAAVTALGRILRRWKLDELPQLVNVLRGDMVLVGPRPCLPTQQALIEARIRTGAFSVRPGITGLAQVLRVDMSRPEELAKIDGHYARTRTWRGDLNILLQTVFGRGLRHDPMAKRL